MDEYGITKKKKKKKKKEEEMKKRHEIDPKKREVVIQGTLLCWLLTHATSMTPPPHVQATSMTPPPHVQATLLKILAQVDHKVCSCVLCVTGSYNSE